jgi:hypothetical protein
LGKGCDCASVFEQGLVHELLHAYRADAVATEQASSDDQNPLLRTGSLSTRHGCGGGPDPTSSVGKDAGQRNDFGISGDVGVDIWTGT